MTAGLHALRHGAKVTCIVLTGHWSKMYRWFEKLKAVHESVTTPYCQYKLNEDETRSSRADKSASAPAL